jgi:hypothetical protein
MIAAAAVAAACLCCPSVQDKSMHFMGLRGASNCYIFNRRPTEHCCGQIWHGVAKQEDNYSYVISTDARKLELTTL